MLTFVAAFLVIVLSALCSGSEAALFAISNIRVKQLAEEGTKAALTLQKIKDNMSRPISAIVIFNNIANISGTILVASIAQKEHGENGVLMTTFLLPVVVIIFSEILPKTLAERHSEGISLAIARPISFVTTVLTLPIFILEKLLSFFVSEVEERLTTDEKQIRFLTEVGHTEGVIEKRESEMILKVFDLNDVNAVDIMTPRVKMASLKNTMTLGEAHEQIVKLRFSRVLLVGESADKVIGVLHRSELLVALVEGKLNQSLMDFVHKVRFVPEQATADKLLKGFQESRQHLAVVSGEHGGVSGVVTLEDVLEVLTGDIYDESDQETLEIRRHQ